MNGRRAKEVRRKGRKILVEWLRSIIPDEEDSKQIKKSITAAAESTTKSSNKAEIICPKCGKEGVPIVYGKPGRKTMEKADEKKVYLGGCVIRKDVPNPKYHCYHCGNNWGTKN